ncbi:TRDC protein, partial [Galbula dea]|nr:TRDC protein [Galbula dea]
MKSKKPKEDGSLGKAACLARNSYTKNISLEMSPNEVLYEQSRPVLTPEGLYNTIKVVSVTEGTEVTCMAKSDGSTFSATLPEKEAEEPVTEKVCNTTDTSTRDHDLFHLFSITDTKGEKANMLSMAVLGLRVLLAKTIAVNTLMSIKLFLF